MPTRHAERATAPTDSANSPIGIDGQIVHVNSFHDDRHPEGARLKAAIAGDLDARGLPPVARTL